MNVKKQENDNVVEYPAMESASSFGSNVEFGLSEQKVDESFEKVNILCAALSLSPLQKKAKLNFEKKKDMGNRKLGKIFDSVATELSSALNITLLNESGQNSEDYSKLLKELKTKFNASTSFTERKQLLTLAPSSWPRSRVAEEFQCSGYIVRESRSIYSKFGILPKVTKKKSGNKISEENKLIVASFYEESSRVFPGLKDSITVINKDGVRRKIQKMLLTENISELHYLFQQQYPNIRIGLSKFFELRPRWCIFAGAPGTH